MATFEHASTEGWATYHQRMHGWRWLICAVVGHRLPAKPDPANGYSPGNYARCSRCRNPFKWFVVRQHRYGGLAL